MARTGPKSKYDILIGSVRTAYEENGMTDQEIGDMLGIPRDTIYSWRVKAGIKSSPRPSKYEKPSRDVLLKEWKNSFETKPRGGLGGYLTQGSSVRVAESLGVTPGIAKKWLKEEGILQPRKTFKTHGKEAVRLYTEEGLPAYRVAEILGVSDLTISSWLKKYGVNVISSMERRTKEEAEKVREKISRTKVGDEVFDLFSCPEKVLDFSKKNGTKTSLGLARKVGVSSFYTDNKLKELGIWEEFDHVSSFEDDMHEILMSEGVESIVRNSRKIIPPMELDLFASKEKVGIEFNGTYWHSETHKDRLYHQKKTKLAEDAGIHLIHVWEYDWEEKRDQYLSIIRNALGLNERKVAARKCEVREISPAEKKDFLEEHHFQGNDNAKIRLGLFFEEELISVMTFGRARFVKKEKFDFELLRFCSKSGVSVQGGASKLFSNFRKMHPSASVLSYSDNGRTTGSLYKTLGFRMSHESSPSYIWTNYEDVLSRYQTQAHRLKEDPELQEKYGEELQGMSEADIMHAEGYVRIFDAGSKVWVYTP